ncbi:MAG: ABC transporter substrate-binding protein [Candidatus Hodarchaeales archaeon]
MNRKLKLSIILGTFLVGIFALSMTQPVSAAREDAAWFYDNFTPEKRLHVRKAIDYAIPRDQIIESVLQGLGSKIASPVEANDGAYDPTVQAREFNLTKALDHMEAAFGYRYNDSAVDDEDRLGYFSMVILAPTSRDDRMEWAALTTKTLQEIGIDVTLKYANWNIAVPRVFDRPTEGTQGFDYAHGGYDGFFIGWTGSPESDVSQWFYERNFIPAGTNLGYLVDAEVEEILDRALESLELDDRLTAFDEFQQWFKDNLPYYIVLQLDDLWAQDPDLAGVSLSFDYPNYQNWTHPTDTIAKVMTPGDFIDMNPHQIGSYYDQLAVGDVFEGLISRTAKDANTYYGQIAENEWDVSADKLVWTFKVRDGLKWSDGSALTVDDVVFSYQDYLDPDTQSYGATSLAVYLNASNVVKVNDTSVRFTMNKFYAYQISNFGLAILQKAQMEPLTGAQHKTDAATNAQFAPIGSGPYMMDTATTSISTGHVELIANPHYTNTRGDPDWNNPNRMDKIFIDLYPSAASAVAALKSGALNIIDSNVALQPYRAEINASQDTADHWGMVTQTVGWGHQGFYVNQFSPIWGANPGDPREMYPEDYGGSAPFDLVGVFFGLLMLASIQMIRKRK